MCTRCIRTHRSTFEFPGQIFELWRALVPKNAGYCSQFQWQSFLKTCLYHFLKVSCSANQCQPRYHAWDCPPNSNVVLCATLVRTLCIKFWKDIQKDSEQPACTGLTQLVPVVHVCASWISSIRDGGPRGPGGGGYSKRFWTAGLHWSYSTCASSTRLCFLNILHQGWGL